MKKIKASFLFTAVFLLVFAKVSSAQGNLQFNQVILIELAQSGTQAITVPAGKVWKIESVSMGSSTSQTDVYLRNSSAVNIAHFGQPSSSYTASYPFWLPSGFTGSFVNSWPSYRATISIIEFNVVP
jgi:hypothetical protein